MLPIFSVYFLQGVKEGLFHVPMATALTLILFVMGYVIALGVVKMNKSATNLHVS